LKLEGGPKLTSQKRYLTKYYIRGTSSDFNRRGELRNAFSIFIRKFSGTDHLEDIGAGGRALLELILRKENDIFIE